MSPCPDEAVGGEVVTAILVSMLSSVLKIHNELDTWKIRVNAAIDEDLLKTAVESAFLDLLYVK